MTTLAIRRSVFQGLTAKQRKIMHWVLDRIELGDPADYTAPGNTRWLVWDDPMIDLKDLAALGTLAGNFPAAATAVADDDDTPRKALREFVMSKWKLDEPPMDEPNPHQWVLTNNGAPASVRAGTLPDAWIPTP